MQKKVECKHITHPHPHTRTKHTNGMYLSAGGIIVGIQHVRDVLATLLVLDALKEISLVKVLEIKLTRRLRTPQTNVQSVECAVTLRIGVSQSGQYLYVPKQ